MNRKVSFALAGTIAIVAVIAGMLLSRALLQRSESSPAAQLTSGTMLEPPRPLPSFSLLDHHGDPFTHERLQDHWTFMFFGFANCPDVCPMTLRTLSQISESLSDLPQPQQPAVVFVSVDPKRDTPESLAKYVQFFHSSFVGVTGAQAELDRFTREMGVPVAITPLENGGYTVDHSGAIFLLDPNGALRALFSVPHSTEAIANDYRLVLAQAQ